MISLDRSGKHNPNWKGGFSLMAHPDELLNLGPEVLDLISSRLKSKVVINLDTGCWNWSGGVYQCNGRARICFGKKSYSASRISFIVFKGPVGNLHVLHTCDNVLCISPKHLFLGTSLENSLDMTNKNRQAKWDKNGGVKLSKAEVRAIIKASSSGERFKKLALKYKVCTETIRRIVKGKSWKGFQ